MPAPRDRNVVPGVAPNPFVRVLPDAKPKSKPKQPRVHHMELAQPPFELSTLVAADGAELAKWVVPLPFVKALSLNDRMNHWVKAKNVKEWRDATRWSIRAAQIPHCAQIQAGLHYIPKDMRRRDPDNLVGAFKPVVDALVDEGVVDDDTALYVHRAWPVIHDPDPRIVGGRFWLTVVRLA